MTRTIPSRFTSHHLLAGCTASCARLSIQHDAYSHGKCCSTCMQLILHPPAALLSQRSCALQLRRHLLTQLCIGLAPVAHPDATNLLHAWTYACTWAYQGMRYECRCACDTWAHACMTGPSSPPRSHGSLLHACMDICMGTSMLA